MNDASVTTTSTTSSSMLSFQDGITNLLMETEELRRKIHSVTSFVTPEDCYQILHDLEELLARLYSPQLTVNSNDGDNGIDNIESELRKHCLQKATNVAMLALKLITTKSQNSQGKQEPDPEDENYHAEEEKDCQSTIARISELNLVLCCDGDTEGQQETTKKAVDEIISIYASYQRQVLRQRSKPSIARLVEYRKRQKQMMGINANHEEEDDDDGIGNSSSPSSSSSSQHTKVITTILGQSTSLIHPLMMWRSNLPPPSSLYQLCTKSIQTLDKEAQSLTKTVATWFMEDSKIYEYWMVQMRSSGGGGEEEYNNDYQNGNDIDLLQLDSVVDRLAFCCQLFDRYIQLVVKENNNYNTNQVSDDNASTTTTTTVLEQFHPEWICIYASLERYLTTEQLKSALHPNNNVPVEIVVGAKIQVPSSVEDGTYLSTRALKRAASTRSDQAIGTVAHSIASDVWSTDNNVKNGIYEALIEQRGCYNPHSSSSNNNDDPSIVGNNDKNKNGNGIVSPPSSNNNNSNSFAQALLGALDEDTSSSSGPSPKPMTKPPNSGGLLGSFSSSLASSVVSVGGGGDKLLQIRLETHLCALNGIHSASIACSSLVEFLDSLLMTDDDDGEEEDNTNNDIDDTDTEKVGKETRNAMVHLAREELFRYSRKYDELLHTHVIRVVTEFCGSLEEAPVYKGNVIIPVLRYYLERESYNLPDAKHLAIAEDDERLHKILIRPINDCQLFHQFNKCDSGVVLQLVCREIARVLAELFLDVILSTQNPKKVTDWGSLLFSKQVRLIQNYLQTLMQQAVSSATTSHHQDHQQQQGGTGGIGGGISSQWERLLQAIAILQIEKPSDWLSYYNPSTDDILSPQELKRILSLRIDFSNEAVDRVIASITTTAAAHAAAGTAGNE